MHGFKQIVPTDKFGWHKALLPVYERLFAPMKDTAKMVLEIGCDGGGGVLMYADYFPKAHIVSMDISPMPEILAGNERVTHIQEDAYSISKERFTQMRLPYDVMIEDGNHFIDSQEFFVKNYPQLLSPKGIAIVEDIQKPEYVDRLVKCVPAGFFSIVIDLRHHGRYRRFDLGNF